MLEFDRVLLDALTARGFKHDVGEDGTGHQMKYRRRSGGYYLDAGCSSLIANGDIGLHQWDDIERFGPEGAYMLDGSVVKDGCRHTCHRLLSAAGTGSPTTRE